MVNDLTRFLAVTDVIDWQSPSILALAKKISADGGLPTDIARRSFTWVRDHVQHSFDYERNPITCSASEVLESGTGICYAKSHLLAALLRANGIPAGFCYQRLRIDDATDEFCLHGLNAIHLAEYGWYRVDARGNTDQIEAGFSPPVEQLAFTTYVDGELDFSAILPEPLAIVVDALRAHDDWQQLMDNLPDATRTGFKT